VRRGVLSHRATEFARIPIILVLKPQAPHLINNALTGEKWW
jgi:hypothetical protein